MIRMKKGKNRILKVLWIGLIFLFKFYPVYAANNPISVINNLSDFIFGLIRAIGLILTGFGILQFGMSLKSHDPSQKANSMLSIAGGIIITFTKEILNSIAE